MATQATAKIDAAPVEGQAVEHEGKTYTTIKEGLAYILVPPNARTTVDAQGKQRGEKDTSQPQNVFYNPIQQFNRDLSVLAIRAYADFVCPAKAARCRQKQEKQKLKEERKERSSQHVQNGRGRQGQKRKRDGIEDESAQADEIGKRQQNDHHIQAEEAGEGQKRKRDDVEDESTQSGEVGKRQKTGHVQSAEDLGQLETSNDASENKATTVEKPDQKSTAVLSDTASHEPRTDDPSKNGTDLEQSTDTKDSSAPERKPVFRILDALSATGLRALRYAHEIPAATVVVANDMHSSAVKAIKLNARHNNLASAIHTNTDDAKALLYTAAFSAKPRDPTAVLGKFDVIDLDPYGTAAPFVDAALQALNDDGLLCVTYTDSANWASCGYSEKAFSLYGGLPVKGLHSHEAGLRLLLHSIAQNAAKYGLAIEPLLSLSIDFYARFFVRVRRSPYDVKFNAGRTMLVYECDYGCGAWATQSLGRFMRHKKDEHLFNYTIAQGPASDRLCEHCKSKMHVAGPMWGGPIHHPAFVEKVLKGVKGVDPEIYKTKPRLEGMLDMALDEVSMVDVFSDTEKAKPSKNGIKEPLPRLPPELIDRHPFYFIPSALCKVIKAIAPPEAMVKGALRGLGYIATRSHCKAGSIKTNAPWDVIWEVMREWARQKAPIKEGALKETQAGWHIMQKMRAAGLETPGLNEEIKETVAAEVSASDSANGTSNEVVGKGEDPPTTTTTTTTTTAIETPRIKVVFDAELGKDRSGKRLVRYQMNPRENWGPMTKAKGKSEVSKSSQR